MPFGGRLEPRGESGKKAKKEKRERERDFLSQPGVFRARCKSLRISRKVTAQEWTQFFSTQKKKLAILDHFLCQARGADDDWL